MTAPFHVDHAEDGHAFLSTDDLLPGYPYHTPQGVYAAVIVNYIEVTSAFRVSRRHRSRDCLTLRRIRPTEVCAEATRNARKFFATIAPDGHDWRSSPNGIVKWNLPPEGWDLVPVKCRSPKYRLYGDDGWVALDHDRDIAVLFFTDARQVM